MVALVERAALCFRRLGCTTVQPRRRLGRRPVPAAALGVPASSWPCRWHYRRGWSLYQEKEQQLLCQPELAGCGNGGAAE